jgi:hypothetical protein
METFFSSYNVARSWIMQSLLLFYGDCRLHWCPRFFVSLQILWIGWTMIIGIWTSILSSFVNEPRVISRRGLGAITNIIGRMYLLSERVATNPFSRVVTIHAGRSLAVINDGSKHAKAVHNDSNNRWRYIRNAQINNGNS